MDKALLVACAAGALLLVANVSKPLTGTVAFADDLNRNVVIINKATSPIISVEAINVDYYGDWLWYAGWIDIGGSETVNFDDGMNYCRMDIYVKFEDGTDHTAEDINVCEADGIEFY